MEGTIIMTIIIHEREKSGISTFDPLDNGVVVCGHGLCLATRRVCCYRAKARHTNDHGPHRFGGPVPAENEEANTVLEQTTNFIVCLRFCFFGFPSGS
jgi:hypothetical protein